MKADLVKMWRELGQRLDGHAQKVEQAEKAEDFYQPFYDCMDDMQNVLNKSILMMSDARPKK